MKLRSFLRRTTSKLTHSGKRTAGQKRRLLTVRARCIHVKLHRALLSSLAKKKNQNRNHNAPNEINFSNKNNFITSTKERNK